MATQSRAESTVAANHGERDDQTHAHSIATTAPVTGRIGRSSAPLTTCAPHSHGW
jgi:hypothetical protein